MSYNPNNPNGQATMANSAPVVVASNQSAIPITDNSGSLTVDGTVTVTQSTATNLKVDASGVAVPVTDNSGSLTVDGTITASNTTGNVAAGATDSGNPVKIGGINTTTKPTLTDGQRGDAQLDTRGNLQVTLFSNNTNTALAALADNSDAVAVSSTNNKLSAVSRGTVYNGTSWDRMPGDTTGVKIQDGGNSITVDGSLTTVSTVTNLSQLGGSAIAMNTGTRSAGTQRVTIATDDVVPASQSGTWTVQPGNTANTTPWLVTQIPSSTGGLSVYHLVSSNTTNATVVKNSAGQLYGYYIHNSNASPRKVAFHNASSTPTAGASIYFTVTIPGSAGANVHFNSGIAFGTGIAFTTVTGLADSDTTAVATNDLIINLFYK